MIVVVARQPTINFGTYDAAHLLAVERESVPLPGASGITSVGTMRPLARPPGTGRRDVVTITFADGARSKLTSIYDGHTVVTVKCQELADAAAVNAACSAVLASMQIVLL